MDRPYSACSKKSKEKKKVSVNNGPKLQSKISKFFAQTPTKSDENKHESAMCKKRKMAVDRETIAETKPDAKIRKVSANGMKEHEKSDCKKGEPNQKHIDALFDDVDFCFEDIAVDLFSKSKPSVEKKMKTNAETSGKSREVKYDDKISQITANKSSNTSLKCLENENENEKNEKADDLELDSLFEDDWICTSIKADLSTFKRCQILTVEYCPKETLVSVKDLDDEGEATVRCRDFWKDLQLSSDQICTIRAVKKSDEWVIDNADGLLIVYPDTLMSGTTIVGGLFCQRRSVLQDIFSGLQTLPHYEPDSLTMTTGVIAHEILQEALQRKIYTLSGIKDIYNEIMQSDSILQTFYANNLTVAEVHKHTEPYLNHIYSFMQMYVLGKTASNSNKLQCQINQVIDIEENVWLPKLGLKGKIDVTAEVKIHSKRKVMPIEIKTGKPSFSAEHRGQTMLYILMMKMIGKNVDSGLLLYLKDNIIQEIKGSHSEIRDLVLFRNNLAHYLSNKLEYSESGEGINKYSLKLPKPISHPACERCSVNTLCCTYLNREKDAEISTWLTKVSEENLSDLSPAHIEYVMKWVILLQLEQAAETANFPQSDIWTLKPEVREKKRMCISNLKLSGVVKDQDRYIHTFTREKSEDCEEVDFSLFDFSEGEYIVISTNDRVNITPGRIHTTELNKVSVKITKDISVLFSNCTFHIDKYGSSSLIAFNNYGNVGGLLDNHENCARLREIVIDRTPASFAKKIPPSVISIATPLIKSLNSDQKNAIMKVLACNNYVLIKGMPGTGKTQTLVVLIELLVKLGKSVLVTAHTNSAVDNIFLKLMKKGVDFLRLGSMAKTHPDLHPKCDLPATKHCKTPESLHAAYCSRNVIGVTCYSASHPLMSKRKFDICIVDESTQVLQPIILRPLYNVEKFVLVGDPEQLPPVARSDEARKIGLNESLFKRLDSDNNTVCLRLQYRMNSRIMDVANKLTYNGELLAANEEIAQATLKVKDVSIIESSEKWIQTVLSVKLNDSAIVINTNSTWEFNLEDYSENIIKTNEHLSNAWETAIIVKIIDVLLKAGVVPTEIGVTAPYRAQVAFLKKCIHNDVEINTVDQYQGRDKEVIIYSCAKSCKTRSKKEFDLLDDHSRLTVAVTRAKHKLIIVGDKSYLDQFKPFNKLFQSVNEEHMVTVENGKDDFNWTELLQSVSVTE